MNDDLGIQIGKKLKLCREAAQLTQAQLAVLTLKSVETISNFERGKTLPSVQTLALLARHLGIQLPELFVDAQIGSIPDDPLTVAIANKSRVLSDKDKQFLIGIIELLIAKSRA